MEKLRKIVRNKGNYFKITYKTKSEIYPSLRYQSEASLDITIVRWIETLRFVSHYGWRFTWKAIQVESREYVYLILNFLLLIMVLLSYLIL